MTLYRCNGNAPLWKVARFGRSRREGFAAGDAVVVALETEKAWSKNGFTKVVHEGQMGYVLSNYLDPV